MRGKTIPADAIHILRPDVTLPSDTLDAIAADVKACTRCSLGRGRKNAVPGEGSGISGTYFIGEGPGHHENEQGRPFVGAAGQLLTELLESIGLERRAVWITNVVRCRPPDNRDPLPQEIEACGSFTKRQLDVLQPKVVVTLGRHAMARFLPGESISRAHGQPRRSGDYVVFPMYHPAAALRQGSLRPQLAEDFRKLADFLERTPATTPQPATPDARPATQPTLF
jgi:DNA polymerase